MAIKHWFMGRDPWEMPICLAAWTVLLAGPVSYVGNHLSHKGTDVTGIVREFKQDGFLFHTNEGQLDLDGIVGDEPADRWEFSVPKDRGALAQDIAHYQETGQRVRISYTKHLTPWWPNGESRRYVIDIQPAQE